MGVKSKGGGRGKKTLPAKDTLNNTNNTHNTRPNTSSPPAKLAPFMQSPGLVPKDTRKSHNNSDISSNEPLGLAVGQTRDLGEQPVVGARGLLPGGLLLLAGLLSRAVASSCSRSMRDAWVSVWMDCSIKSEGTVRTDCVSTSARLLVEVVTDSLGMIWGGWGAAACGDCELVSVVVTG
jgi:hypothetical protein